MCLNLNVGMHEDGEDQWVTIANPWNASLMESLDNGGDEKIEERMDGLQINARNYTTDILEPSGASLRLSLHFYFFASY